MTARVLRHVFLAWYLYGTLCGLGYTLFRFIPFNTPWQLVTHHYAMMAPWQSYTRHNVEMVAEGLNQANEWESIDLNQYFPHSRGERAIRDRLSSFNRNKNEKYLEIAKRAYALERDQGRVYSSVRILWHKWPKSPDGFYVNYTDNQIQSTELARYDVP